MRQQIYGETVQLRAPAGFNAAVNAVARQSHTTASEYIRRVVLREIEGAGVRLTTPERFTVAPQNSGVTGEI